MLFNLDSFIIIAFLGLTFITGIGHSTKIKTLEEYALGGRNFSTGALVATLVATWISGSGFFSTLSRAYTDGLYYIIADGCMAFSFIITAYLFIPRMGEFLGNTSIAESMGALYGKNVRIITATTGIIASVGLIAVQFKVFGSLFTYFLGFSKLEAIVIASMIVTIYSALGGIKSVTFTDIIQAITFGIAIPIIGIMIWNQFYYGNLSFSRALNDPKFNFREVFDLGNPNFLQMLPLMVYFAIPGLEPAFYQRILMGKNLLQVKKVFIVAASLVILIKLSISWVPFLIFNVNSTLKADELLGFIINNYTFITLKGFLVAGIVAMAMSTADSHINASSVLFANDICIPLNCDENKGLLISKIFTMLLGAIGILLALVEKDLLSIVLTANSFYMPIVTIPIMMSMLGFRSSTKSVLIGMGAGFATVIIWKLMAIKIDVIVFAMAVNLIFLMGSHYLLNQPGGWVGIKDKNSFEELKQNELELKKKRALNLKKFNIVSYCKKYFPSNEFSYIGLGLYIILYSIITMYTTRVELLKGDTSSTMILAFYQIVLITGTAFFTYPAWPKSINSEKKQLVAQFLWPLVIFFSLILFNTFFVMVSHFNSVQSALFSANIIITIMLLRWRLAMIFIAIGLFSAFKLHQFYNPEFVFNPDLTSPASITMSVLALLAASTVIFFKPKQEYLEKTEEDASYFKDQAEIYKEDAERLNKRANEFSKEIKNVKNQLEQKSGDLKDTEKYLKEKLKLMHIEVETVQEMKDEFIRNVPHESNTPMTAVLSLSEVLHSCYDKLDEGDIKQALKGIVKGGERLKSYVNNIADLSKLSSLSYKLNIQPINLTTLVKQRPNLYTKIFADDKKQEFIFNIKEDIIIRCDEYYLTQAIDNLISNAVQYGKGKPITITLEQVPGEKNELAVEKVKFEIKDQGIGIAETDLVNIFNTFTVSSKTKTIAGGRGVGLALCEKIIKLHSGEIHCKSDGKTGSTFSFIIPGFVGSVENAF